MDTVFIDICCFSILFFQFFTFIVTKYLVESSLKSQHDGGEFDHLVAYSLACTFENKIVSARKYDGICFGSLDQVMNDDELMCCLKDAKTRRMEGFEGCSTHRA